MSLKIDFRIQSDNAPRSIFVPIVPFKLIVEAGQVMRKPASNVTLCNMSISSSIRAQFLSQQSMAERGTEEGKRFPCDRSQYWRDVLQCPGQPLVLSINARLQCQTSPSWINLSELLVSELQAFPLITRLLEVAGVYLFISLLCFYGLQPVRVRLFLRWRLMTHVVLKFWPKFVVSSYTSSSLHNRSSLYFFFIILNVLAQWEERQCNENRCTSRCVGGETMIRWIYIYI